MCIQRSFTFWYLYSEHSIMVEKHMLSMQKNLSSKKSMMEFNEQNNPTWNILSKNYLTRNFVRMGGGQSGMIDMEKIHSFLVRFQTKFCIQNTCRWLSDYNYLLKLLFYWMRSTFDGNIFLFSLLSHF